MEVLKNGVSRPLYNGMNRAHLNKQVTKLRFSTTYDRHVQTCPPHSPHFFLKNKVHKTYLQIISFDE